VIGARTNVLVQDLDQTYSNRTYQFNHRKENNTKNTFRTENQTENSMQWSNKN